MKNEQERVYCVADEGQAKNIRQHLETLSAEDRAKALADLFYQIDNGQAAQTRHDTRRELAGHAQSAHPMRTELGQLFVIGGEE